MNKLKTLIKDFFTYKPKFKVGDIIRARDSEIWETKNDREILEIGKLKYRYLMIRDNCECEYYIEHIDSAYNKVIKEF